MKECDCFWEVKCKAACECKVLLATAPQSSISCSVTEVQQGRKIMDYLEAWLVKDVYL